MKIKTTFNQPCLSGPEGVCPPPSYSTLLYALSMKANCGRKVKRMKNKVFNERTRTLVEIKGAGADLAKLFMADISEEESKN